MGSSLVELPAVVLHRGWRHSAYRANRNRSVAGSNPARGIFRGLFLVDVVRFMPTEYSLFDFGKLSMPKYLAILNGPKDKGELTP